MVDLSAEVQAAKAALAPAWQRFDAVRAANVARLAEAFRACRIASHQLGSSTGYGYDDAGRDAVEAVFAQVFGAEAALVRPQLVSGTHAIACALFGVLRPGDTLVSLGRPYDTLLTAIHGPGGLREWGICYRELPFPGQGPIAWGDDPAAPAVVMVQRSPGYQWRAGLSTGDIAQLLAAAKARYPESVFFVDNCYGEFVEASEPTHAGVDLMAGSLIKNPGGTLAPSGGYLVGRQGLIERAAARLIAPGLRHMGPSLISTRLILQGLWLAPQLVGEALCTVSLFAQALAARGYAVSPAPDAVRTDAVQAIRFGAPDRLVAFCRAVQAASPVDGFVRPEPAPLPGYDHDVIMAAGTFVQGASSEFSADAPMRAPYIAYLQGGTSRDHALWALPQVLAALC